MPLSPQQTSILNNASRHPIEIEFTYLAQNWVSNQWLKSNNKYASDPIKKIKKDKTNRRLPVYSHLRQYIAASSLTHCMDGWSFLGRAIEAHLKGDSDVSRHLGYYSELRAAMALLASEGIGVFDNNHFIVDNHRTCKGIPGDKSTHKFTWEALEFWISTNAATDLIFSVIKPGGLPLKEWMNNFHIGSGSRSIIASNWLKQWGIDIKRLCEDRDSRNFASYRPTAFTAPRALNIDNIVDQLSDFWVLFEPSETLRFAKLDRFLLKDSLQTFFKFNHPQKRTHTQAKNIFRQQIDNMLHFISPSDLTSQEWSNFLNNSDSTLILSDARGQVGHTDPNHHRQVIARASLLLRISTGSCSNFLCSLNQEDINSLCFWWTRIGEDRCLWHNGNEPENIIDLWADIHDALQDLISWDDSSTEKSYYNFWKINGSSASTLGTCERIGLWGLGL